jgi:hypothetical protein
MVKPIRKGRNMIKYALPDAGKPRKREPIRTIIEDTVSKELVLLTTEQITKFAHQCKAVNGAVVYTHGGYSLYSFVQYYGHGDELEAMVEAFPTLKGIVAPLLTPPKDIDMSVIATKPSTCATRDQCFGETVQGEVMKLLRNLRRRLHNRLLDKITSEATLRQWVDATKDHLREDLNLEMLRLSLTPVNSYHATMQHEGGNGVRILHGLRDKKHCHKGNMHLISETGEKSSEWDCYPLRESFNTLIDFTNNISSVPFRANFNLLRLALFVEAKYLKRDADVEVQQYIPVNFLDISFPKAGDHVYTANKINDLMKDIKNDKEDIMPFPSLGYVADATEMQLTYSQGQLKTDLSDDDRAYNEANVIKLKKRMNAIFILQLLSNEAALDTVTVPEVWQTICGQVKWYSQQQAEAMAIKMQKDAYLSQDILQKMRGAAGQISAQITDFVRASKAAMTHQTATKFLPPVDQSFYNHAPPQTYVQAAAGRGKPKKPKTCSPKPRV